MMKLESLEAVHIHTHTIHSTQKNGNYLLDELHSNEINKTKDKGIVFAFICDKLKDRNKAILNRVPISEILFCKNQKLDCSIALISVFLCA